MIYKTQRELTYDTHKWREVEVKPQNTLQVFITNSCDMRCRGCFYAKGLGRGLVQTEEYRELLMKYSESVSKVILLGGEPFLHPNLQGILGVNREHWLKTTIYTNGHSLDRHNVVGSDVSLRIGVYGSTDSEKPLSKVKDTPCPVTIVYMLRKDNVQQLRSAARMAEERFNCKCFYVSSIRDIGVTGDYWKDTDETLTPAEFADIAQDFVSDYDGNIPRLDVATRGVLFTESQRRTSTSCCRFGNVFPDKSLVQCPFDIALKVNSEELTFGKRKCNKHNACILQKVSLVRT